MLLPRVLCMRASFCNHAGCSLLSSILACSYSSRYPTDARYAPQEESQLLRRGTPPPNPAAALTSSALETPEPASASESREDNVQDQSSEEQRTAQDEGEAGGKADDSTQGKVECFFIFAHACQARCL